MCLTDSKENMGSGKYGASIREVKRLRKVPVPLDPGMTAWSSLEMSQESSGE